MRIVVFRIDKIGDLIVSTPVFAAIKARHPGAKIMAVAAPYNSVVLEGLPGVDETVLYDKDAPLKKKLGVLKAIRRFAPTHTLVLSPKNDCYFLALFSGAKRRGGLVTAYRWLPRMLAPLLLTDYIFIPRRGVRPHQTDGALQIARQMGLAADGNFPYRLGRSKPAEEAANRLLEKSGVSQPFIAVHLSDKWLEVWRKEDLIFFLQQASQQLGVKVVATAGPAERHLAGAVSAAFPVFSGLPFAEWCAVLNKSACIIAHDGSPFHIACALERPLLAVYLSWHLDEAVSGFGPRGTRFCTQVISDAPKDIPLMIENLKGLLA
jgi:ADP-heptose:LPS heptosyltransferase